MEPIEGVGTKNYEKKRAKESRGSSRPQISGDPAPDDVGGKRLYLRRAQSGIKKSSRDKKEFFVNQEVNLYGKQTEEVGKDEKRLAHRSRNRHCLAYLSPEGIMGRRTQN